MFKRKWPDISNGWSDIPSKKRQRRGEKTMGKEIGRKERKKRKKKKGNKKEER